MGLSVPAQASRSISSKRPSSASPANSEMPIFCAAAISCGISFSIDMQPETWKPPSTDRRPASRKGCGQVDSARILVGLDAHQADQRLAAAALHVGNDLVRPYALMGLVIGFEMECDALAKHLRRAQSRPMP